MKAEPQIHVGGCQNYGPFLGTLNSRCRIIIGNPKGTIILTTTHVVSKCHGPSKKAQFMQMTSESPAVSKIAVA